MTTKVQLELLNDELYGLSLRQTQRHGPVDSNGHNNALSAGSSLNYNVYASSTPISLNFASGTVDYVSSITSNATNQGALTANTTNYVHATYVSKSSVTWSNCLIPPQRGPTFLRSNAALLNFEANDASTSIIDDFGNTWTAIGNAQIDTAQYKFGTSSLLLDGTGDSVVTTNITSVGTGSWEMSFWFRINALPSSGNSSILTHLYNNYSYGIQLGLSNSGGTTRFAIWASSNGSSWDIASSSTGTNTTWTLSQWNRARVVFDALAGTYRVYLSLNGAAETQDISISSTSRVCFGAALRLGAAWDNSAAFNGWMDAFRYIRCATTIGTETPSASAPSITDYPVHWFSTSDMKMYEATGSSTVAGINPTFTARNRIFIGELETNGTTVTSIRNYPLNFIQNDIPVLGQCRLEQGGNITILKLSRYDGKYLFINGQNHLIPPEGVNLDNNGNPLGLSADTNYYIYAYMNNGKMTLEASTTAYAPDWVYGHRIKSGDKTRSLVGLVRTDAGTNFPNTDTQQYIASWYNQKMRYGIQSVSNAGFTYSVNDTELDSTKRIEWVQFSGLVRVHGYGITYNSAFPGTSYGIVFIDALYPTAGYIQSSRSGGHGDANAGGYQVSWAATIVSGAITDGYHFAGTAGYQSGGTGYLSGGVLSVELIPLPQNSIVA
jgi:hypothetical protein